MSFNEIVEHVINLFSNSNKIFHENEVDLQDETLTARDTGELLKVIRETPEQIALKEYLESLDVETLRKLCTVADYAIDAEKDFNNLAEIHATDDKASCLHQLSKKVQYIQEGQRLIEHDRIQII